MVLTVLVLNYHHRNPETHDMAPWVISTNQLMKLQQIVMKVGLQVKTIFLQWLPWVLRMQRPGKKITRKTIMLNNKMRNLELKERSSRSLLANVLDIDDDIRGTMGMGMGMGMGMAMGMHSNSTNSYLRITGNSMDDSATMHNCLSAQRELQMILKELRYVTGRMKKGDEDSEVISDWKFAAMVVDRFCLIIFTLFTVVATLAVLCTAPHFIT